MAGIKTDPKERQILKKEMLQTMLKRTNTKEKDIYEVALKIWINDNIDVLTKDEIRKYRDIGLLLI